MQSITPCCELHFTEASAIEIQNYSPLTCKPTSLFVGQDERHCKKGTPKERNPMRHIPASCWAAILIKVVSSCVQLPDNQYPLQRPFAGQTEISCSQGHSFICGFNNRAAEPCWHWHSLLWTNLNYSTENKPVLKACQVAWGQESVSHFKQLWELLTSRKCSNA